MKTPKPWSFAGQEESLDVRDGVVLLDALADQPPGDAVLAQDVVLRVDDDQGGVILARIAWSCFIAPVDGSIEIAKSEGGECARDPPALLPGRSMA